MQKRCVCSPARIRLPLEVVPRAASGRVRTYVCGEPELIRVPDRDNPCANRYILRQKLVADIPLEIGATAFAGEPFLQCGGQWAAPRENMEG